MILGPEKRLRELAVYDNGFLERRETYIEDGFELVHEEFRREPILVHRAETAIVESTAEESLVHLHPVLQKAFCSMENPGMATLSSLSPFLSELPSKSRCG